MIMISGEEILLGDFRILFRLANMTLQFMFVTGMGSIRCSFSHNFIIRWTEVL